MLHLNTKKSMNNGYAICFNEWALDSDIKNELNLLLIISSLTAEKGYCFASNKYFAELFETNETLISRKIKKLEKKKYIIIEYEKKGSQIVSRKIRLSKMITVDYRKSKSSIIENDKDNNTSINNTSINNKEIYKEIINNSRIPETTIPSRPQLVSQETNTINNKYINTNNNKNTKKEFFDKEELNDLFNEFLDFRRKLKAVNSDKAITLLINKLNEYDDETKKKMINQSIENSWKSVFPLKKEYKRKENGFELLERLKREELEKQNAKK